MKVVMLGRLVSYYQRLCGLLTQSYHSSLPPKKLAPNCLNSRPSYYTYHPQWRALRKVWTYGQPAYSRSNYILEDVTSTDLNSCTAFGCWTYLSTLVIPFDINHSLGAIFNLILPVAKCIPHKLVIASTLDYWCKIQAMLNISLHTQGQNWVRFNICIYYD